MGWDIMCEAIISAIFLQQAEYTVCIAGSEALEFFPHEEVFGQNAPNQDYLSNSSYP